MGKSSKDKRDIYYRLAKEQKWRARSAFKLLQLDEQFDLFRGVTRVVDLCAAPGSWSQVLSRVLVRGEEGLGRRGWEARREALLGGGMGPGIATGTGRERGQWDADWGDLIATGRGEEGREKGELEVEGKQQGQKDEGEKKANERKAPRKDVKIVAIDLQPMAPLEGIIMLQADITHPSTIPRLLDALDAPTSNSSTEDTNTTSTTDPSDSTPSADNPPISTSTSTPSSPPPTTTHQVDLLLTDGAPDVTGLHDLDIYIQSSLLRSALALALRVLRPGGTFVAKIFRARDVDLLYAQLMLCFDSVVVAKPRASRASSLEAFVVCRGFRVVGREVMRAMGLEEAGELGRDLGAGRDALPGGEEDAKVPRRPKTEPYRRKREDGITELELGSGSDEDDDGQDRYIAPFLSCGDLSAFDYDADATYHLPPGHVSLDPVQAPTEPPYKAALEERRRQGGAYGKTKSQNEPKVRRKRSQNRVSNAKSAESSEVELDAAIDDLEMEENDHPADSHG